MNAVDGFSIPQTILQYFDLTETPYTDQFARYVAERRRRYPQGQLMLDQLLSLASIDGPSSYPPITPASLRRLLYNIHTSEIDRLKRDCFYYYLLLDYYHASSLNSNDLANGDGHMDHDGADELFASNRTNGTGSEKGKEKAVNQEESKAEEFVRRRCLPRMWKVFIYGYWALDNGLWDEAVQAVIDPCISSLNFLSDIFSLISTQVTPPSKALSLLHTMFTSLDPPLDTPTMITLRLISLTVISLNSAYSFIRSQSDEHQSALRQSLLLFLLGSPSIPLSTGPRTVQKGMMKELLHIPLSMEESSHLKSFLLNPPRTVSPAALDVLHDLITLRQIHTGQYAEALQLDKSLAGSLDGDKKREENRQKRREVIREFISILPAVQRRVLEIDVATESYGTSNHIVQDRAGIVNGDVMEIDRPAQGLGNEDIPLQPAPIRNPVLLDISGIPPLPRPMSTIKQRTRNVSSPFSGPPQFAKESPTTPNHRNSPLPRSASINGRPASPFERPSSVIAEIPRPRRIINDDDAEMAKENARPRRKRQDIGRDQVSQSSTLGKERTPSMGALINKDDTRVDKERPRENGEKEHEVTEKDDPASANNMPPPPMPDTIRKSTRSKRTTNHNDHNENNEELAPPSPTASVRTTRSTRSQGPSTSTPARKNTRKSQAPPLPSPTASKFDPSEEMPGAFEFRTESKRSYPKDSSLTSDAEQQRNPGGDGNEKQEIKGKSRMTRSASKATLDDGHDDGRTPKKARTTKSQNPQQSESKENGKAKGKARGSSRASPAKSEISTVSTRRSTRRGTSVVRESRSPTGSVVSTRSKRAGTAGPGVREGSATPRVTRTRKA